MTVKEAMARLRLTTDVVLTDEETLGLAMGITKQHEADAFFRVLVDRLRRLGYNDYTEDEAIKLVKSNLGYYAGYCGSSTQARVNKLYCTRHPVLG